MPPEVLLVENNLSVAQLVVVALREIIPNVLLESTNKVSYALDFLFHTGNFALRPYEQAPNLIVLSLDLPNNDSWELFHVIKSYVRTQNIPIILLGEASTIPTPFGKTLPYTNRFIVKSENHEKFVSTVSRAGAFWLNNYLSQPLTNYGTAEDETSSPHAPS